MKNVDLALHFFLQIVVILLTCRAVGFFAKKCGQPQVVAEMIAGVILGPSLFGYLFPSLQSWVFPWDTTQTTRDTQSYLFPASQLGLALYMFIVGMEFRTDIVRRHLKSSVAVSLAGMFTPFCLGAGIAWVFYKNSYVQLFPEGVSLDSAMIFLGACMCITAFPMLARIIHFRGLSGTTMGTVAIGAGAIDDAAAWCLLALVLAKLEGDWTHAVANISGAVLFTAVAYGIVKPMMGKLEKFFVKNGTLSDTGLVIGISLMSLSAWYTDYLELHAVFGAFVAGSIMPRTHMTRHLIEKMQPLAVALFLPLFFTYSGLNTQIGLLHSAALWGVCSLVLVAAILGKGVACWLAARATGIPHREALGIGALMNARGLMELIIINVGLQRGVISGELFATLVVMAIVTTLMASPLFEFLVGSTPNSDNNQGRKLTDDSAVLTTQYGEPPIKNVA